MAIESVPTLFDRWLNEWDAVLARDEVARPLRPALDLYEHPDRYELVVDLPGWTAKDVEVQFEGGALHLRGARAAEPIPEGARVYRRQRVAGRFHQSIQLGDQIDVDGIEARFQDGVLRVSVPKNEQTRPRQIPVKMA